MKLDKINVHWFGFMRIYRDFSYKRKLAWKNKGFMLSIGIMGKLELKTFNERCYWDRKHSAIMIGLWFWRLTFNI